MSHGDGRGGKPSSRWHRGLLVSAACAVLAALGLAFKDKLAERFGSPIGTALDFVGPAFRAFGTFLSRPARVPSGWMLVAMMILAIFGAFVALANVAAWGLGPRKSQFVRGTFEGVDWRWRWEHGHPRGESDMLRQIEPIVPYCPKCGARLIEEHEKNPDKSKTYYDCGVDGCDFEVTLDSAGTTPEIRVAKRIERDLENGSWRAAVKASRPRGRRFTMDVGDALGRLVGRP